jgi:phosphoribosylglycinamide formyltransferase 1
MSTGAPLKLAILISGRGSNMSAIVRACHAGTIAARPTIVISDRADAAGLTSARELGVPTAAWTGGTGGGAGFEQMLSTTLDAQQADLIALAGFMRILSAPLVGRYLGRMLNIHPSLLPAYRGLNTHRRVLAAGDTEHGASVHFVTAELDGGPVVLQSRVAVEPGDSEAALAARVQATEHVIYPRVLAWFSEGRLAWRDGAAWLDGRPLDTPIVEDFRGPVVFPGSVV